MGIIKSQLDKKQPSLFFDQWAEDSVISDEQGVPKTLYHGTIVPEYKSFDLEKSDPYNFLGSGFYFTDSPEDASANYSSASGDWDAKIDRLADQIYNQAEDDEEYAKSMGIDLSNWQNAYDRSKEIALQQLTGKTDVNHLPARSMPVYLKMKNPAILSPHAPDKYFIEYDEETGEEKGNVLELMDIITNIAYEYGLEGEDVWAEISEYLNLLDGFNDYDLYQAISNSGVFENTYDDSDNLLSTGGVFREIMRDMGHDGVIMDTWKYFGPNQYGKGMPGIDPDTKHYIVWNPTQIKSSIGNSGIYDPKNPDITANSLKLIKISQQLDDLGFYRDADLVIKKCPLYRGHFKQD